MKDSSKPHAQPALTEETDRLYDALESAGIGTWTLYPGRSEVTWDERCRELYGFAPGDQVPYDEVLRYIHADERQSVFDSVARALDPAIRAPYEVQFRTIGAQDGRLRWLYCRGKAHFDEAGMAYRFSGTAQDITELIQSREQLAAVERRASLALDATHAGYFSIPLDDSGQMEWSPVLVQMLTGAADKGLTRADFIRHLHPDDRKLRKQAYEQADRTGRLDYKARFVWGDDTVHWMHITGSYLNDTSGKPYLFVGTCHDITAEVAGRQQAERYNQLIAASHDWMGIAAPDGFCDFINSSGLALQGLSGDAFTGMSLYDCCTQASANALRTICIPATLARGIWEGRLELRHFRATKVVIPVYFKITLQRDAQGQPQSLVAVARDLRSEEAAMQALRENESLFRNVTSSSPTGLWLSDREGSLTYLNKTLIDWTGMPYRDLLGAGWSYAIIDEDREESVRLFSHAISTRTHYEAQFRIRKGDGSVIWCSAEGDPFYTPEGEYAGYAGFCMDIEDQVKSANAYRESEARFRSIVEQAPMAIGLLRGSDMVVEVGNDAIFKLWGKDRSVTGLPITEALPEIKDQPFPALLRQVYETGEPHYGTATRALLAHDGELRESYFDFVYTPLRGNDNHIDGVMVLATDVTAQVVARKKVEESEARFRSLIAAAPTAIVLYMGRDLIIEHPNQAFIDMLGRGDTMTGKPLRIAMPELEGQPFLQILDDVFTTGKGFESFDTQVAVMHHGVLTNDYYDFSYTPLFDADGAVYAILQVASNVTFKVKSRQQITEAEEALRSAIELAELATWSLDLESRVANYSARLQGWFGFREGETVYNTGYNPVHPKDRQRLQDAIAAAAAMGGTGLFNIEYTAVEYRTARERIIHAQGRVTLDTEGRAIRLTGTAQDVTAHREIQLALELEVQERTEELQTVNEELQVTNEELYESNTQLTHSNEELAQYAYVASHDLQEPLRKIRMFSGMLGKAALTSTNQMLVEKINQSAERMTQLIRDLLDFSRLLKTDSLMQPVHLGKVMNDVANDFELSVTEKNATIEVGDLPVIEGISLQMNQLFYNLLGNALKFIKPGVAPLIRVTADELSREEAAPYLQRILPFSRYYRISFSDNGIGFEVKYAEQIFEVFKRLHNRDLYPGSGIGLALCRRIVGNHNGHLYAESRPGEGTTFHIILPDRQSNHQPTLPGHFVWTED